MSFEGFPPATFAFLRGIAEHNDKRWFEAHRAEHEAGYVEPAKRFVEAIGPKLRKISKTVRFEARVGGSLFRIHRDVRFSKDKSPYKPHLDLFFWEGEEKSWGTPGFFFRMFHDRLMLGAGMHGFDKDALARYRDAVLDERAGKELVRTIAAVSRSGCEVGGATRKSVPRGMDPAHPRAQLLLHEGLHAGWEGRIPREARSATMVDFCLEHFAHAAPISRWLLAHVAGR